MACDGGDRWGRGSTLPDVGTRKPRDDPILGDLTLYRERNPNRPGPPSAFPRTFSGVTRPRKREIKRGATLLSDRDRDQAVAALRESYADGSLTLEEYSRRVDNVLASRTRAQLEPVVKELEAAAHDSSGNATPPRRPAVPSCVVCSWSRPWSQ